MSNPHRPYLPPEILDLIIGLLCDQPKTLERCCLVSRSWVPRTRRHLFSSIEFGYSGDLGLWKGAFPDPENSPAYHTRTLRMFCPDLVTGVDTEEGGWIRAFSRIVRLEVWSHPGNSPQSDVSLTPFHTFSPTLKSLRIVSTNSSCSQIFTLVRSLPLLEDLCVIDEGMDKSDDETTNLQPSTSPALTGSLELDLPYGMEGTARRLFDLPNGLHFRRFVCIRCVEEDLRWIMGLVKRCSDTLEYIDIRCYLSGTFLRLLQWDQCLS